MRHLRSTSADTGLRASLALLLASTLLLGGCAFGVRNATLRYPPAPEAGVVPAARAAEVAPRKGEIALLPIKDARTDKSKLGTVRNGFGMKTADVVTADDIPLWLTGALRTELARAGYQVKDAGTETAGGTTLAGDLNHLWCDAYFTYLGEITLAVRLRRDGRELLAKEYQGSGGAGMNWVASAEAYGQTLAIALADALRRLVADVDKVLSSP